jgi:hypothetical protein
VRKCRRICLVLSRIRLFFHPLALIKPTITSKKCCLRHFIVLFRHVFHLISKKYITFSRKCRRFCFVLSRIRLFFHPLALIKPTITSKKCCLRHFIVLYRHVFHLISKKYITFSRKCRRFCLVLSRIRLFFHPLALIKPTITSKKCCLRHFIVLFRHVFHLISKKYITFSRKCRRFC